MIGLLLLPIYFFLNVIVLKRVMHRIVKFNNIFSNKYMKVVIAILYFAMSLSPLMGLILSPGSIRYNILLVSYYWIFSFLYFLLFVVLVYFLKKLFSKIKFLQKFKVNDNQNNAFTFIIIIILALILITGTFNAYDITTTKYDVKIENKQLQNKNLKIALVADLHIGFNSGGDMAKRVVKEINRNNPDIVVFAGDIFDNELSSDKDTEKIIQEFRNIKNKYGVYAVLGNHDAEEKLFLGFSFNKKEKIDNNMIDILNKSNIKLLKDEYLKINDEFYLVGRLDQSKNKTRKSIDTIMWEVKKEKPVIVIDHQPDDLNSLNNANVDLLLSGHTHGGQLFPGNQMIRLFWYNSYGYKKYHNLHTIVTSGTGTYGMKIRLGVPAEVAIINLKY